MRIRCRAGWRNRIRPKTAMPERSTSSIRSALAIRSQNEMRPRFSPKRAASPFLRSVSAFPFRFPKRTASPFLRRRFSVPFLRSPRFSVPRFSVSPKRVASPFPDSQNELRPRFPILPFPVSPHFSLRRPPHCSMCPWSVSSLRLTALPHRSHQMTGKWARSTSFRIPSPPSRGRTLYSPTLCNGGYPPRPPRPAQFLTHVLAFSSAPGLSFLLSLYRLPLLRDSAGRPHCCLPGASSYTFRSTCSDFFGKQFGRKVGRRGCRCAWIDVLREVRGDKRHRADEGHRSLVRPSRERPRSSAAPGRGTKRSRERSCGGIISFLAGSEPSPRRPCRGPAETL
jgi:hypothetical protein